MFNSNVPSSFFTAPNAPWTLQFTVEENPALYPHSGQTFHPYFTDFHYILDSVDLGVTASDIAFYTA